MRSILHEADGHLGNEKLFWHIHAVEQEEQDREGRDPIFKDLLLCQNHQCNLIVSAVIGNMPQAPDTQGTVLANMLTTTKFLRMGGHYTRLLAAVERLVKGSESDSLLEWIPRPSAAQLAEEDAGKAYMEEVASYLCDNLRHSERQMSASVAPGRSSKFASSPLVNQFGYV